MRSIFSEIIFFIVLIAQKYSGKVDLWGAFRQTSFSQRDSKRSHEIEASGQPVQDGV